MKLVTLGGNLNDDEDTLQFLPFRSKSDLQDGARARQPL